LFLVKKSMILMGTSVTMYAVHPEPAYPQKVIEEAFDEFKRIEKIMSIYDDGSEVFKLNKQGFLNNASEDLIYVLKEAEKISRLTRGVYDVSVLPLMEYLEERFREDGSADEKLSDIVELVDYSSISVSGDTVRFLKKGMKIVLNSIAKGYAVDLASDILRRYNIRHGMINAGGDIRTIGGKTEQEPWKIAIRDPFNKDKHVCILKLFNGSVATSGVYEYETIRGSHLHIVNPLKKTGESRVVSATVIADKCIVADALATSLCAIEPIEGIQLIEQLDDIEAMLITDEKSILKTSRFVTYEDD